MQNKLKRLAAFLCAFALLVTTVLGSSAMMLVKAADPQESEPVTLDGFANLTLKDFVDKTDVVMEAGEYEGNSGGAHSEYYVKGLTSFHKKILSMKVKFEAGGYKNSLILAGTHGWEGFNIHPNNDGTQLKVGKTWGDDVTTSDTPTLDASDAGVESFINEQFTLELSFEYGEAVGGQADLKLGIYINGKLYNNQVFTIAKCNTSATGAVFALYRQDDGKSIFVDNFSVIEKEPDTPIQLKGFDNLTLKDFVDKNDVVMEAGEYEGNSGGAHSEYYVKGLTSFHKKILSMKVKFEAGGYKNSLILAGTYGWEGFNIHPNNDGTQLKVGKTWGDDVTTSDTPTLDASDAGVESFINEQFTLELSFEYGEAVGGQADLKLGIYINGKLYNNEVFTIAKCNTSATGAVFALYRQDDGKSIFVDNFSVIEKEPDTPGVITPIQLEGFDNLTLKDFVDKTDVVMEAGEYEGNSGGAHSEYYVKGLTSFHKKILSMKVKFEAGGYKNSLILAGTHGWEGFNIHPNNDGTQLKVGKTWGDDVTISDTPTLDASDAGVESFINEQFTLELSFEYGEAVGGQADLKLGIYINGKLYNNEVFTIAKCNTSATGAVFALYRQDDGKSIFIDNISIIEEEPDTPGVITPIQLEGFVDVTVKDFVDKTGNRMQSTIYDASNSPLDMFLLKDHDSFNKKLLSMYVEFTATKDWGTRLDIAGAGEWQGITVRPSADGSTLSIGNIYDSATDGSIIINKGDTTVSKFTGNEFLLQLSFSFGEANGQNKADLEIGIYLNGIYYDTYIVTNCDMSAFGKYMKVYREAEQSIKLRSVGEEIPDTPDAPDVPTEPQQPNESLEKITFAHFNIKDGAYPYNGDIVAQGTLKGHDTLDKTLICGDILLEGEGSYQLLFGGKDNIWDGLRLIMYDADNMHVYWYQGFDGTHITSFNAKQAGISFTNEQFNFKLSIEVKGNDIQVGAWFNDVLYGNQYILISDCADELGNRFGAYCSDENASVKVGSIPELVPPPAPPTQPNENFEKVTFEYFGLKDAIYKCDGTVAPTYEAKGNESLDQKVLCGDILLEGKGPIHLMIGGNANIWYGFRFITQENGTIVLCWIDEEGLQIIEVYDDVTAGATLIGEWLNLMISTEILDADGDGEKDDIELGVWFNGVLYKEEFSTILNKASGLGKQFGFDCVGEDNSIAIRSIPALLRGFDYSVYHLTKDWEKTLLTGHKAEFAVGGSKEAEPFTGDSFKVGKVCLLSAAGLMAVATGVYMLFQRKRES